MLRKVIVGLVAAALAAIAWLAAGFTPQLLAALVLAGITPQLITIDLREHRLPNRLVLPAIVAGLASCAGEWLVTREPPVEPLIGAVSYAAFLLLLHFVGGMGMGDVKLGVALGLASWNVAVVVLSPVIAFLGGGLAASALLIAGRRGAKLAFGPYLLGGYWAVITLVAVVRTL